MYLSDKVVTGELCVLAASGLLVLGQTCEVSKEPGRNSEVVQ